MAVHDVALIINSVIRLLISAVVAWKLLTRFHSLNRPERVGLGLSGGTALLTIPPMMVEKMTPFDDWASIAFAGGFLLYLIGRMMKHARERTS